MNKDYIISFNEFDYSINENNLDEGFQDILMNGLGMLGNGFVKTIKQKAIAYVMTYLKIKEKSPVSKLIQEIFDEIDIKDYYGIVTGKHTNWDFFIPKIAKGFVEFLQRSGFDEVAESIGIESDGYLYSVIRNIITDKIADRKNFTKDIETFLHGIFKDSSPSKGINIDSIINSMGSSERRETLSGMEKISKKAGYGKVSNVDGQKEESSAVSSYIKDLLKGGGKNFVKALRESKN